MRLDDFKVEILNNDFDSGFNAFVDSAAVIKNLDLIITSDTAIAHLAGALGCPTWVALKHTPDWRWMLDQEHSPWYPTVRLFRQKKSGNWENVFNEMYDALMILSKNNLQIYSTPTIPVSWGELIDKITILEIKELKIKSTTAITNVKKELKALLKIMNSEIFTNQVISNLKQSLKEVNEKLWEVEDKIRAKEDKQEFDSIFITLARSVYKLNDKRAELKKQLNIQMASEMVEEKSYTQYFTVTQEKLND